MAYGYASISIKIPAVVLEATVFIPVEVVSGFGLEESHADVCATEKARKVSLTSTTTVITMAAMTPKPSVGSEVRFGTITPMAAVVVEV